MAKKNQSKMPPREKEAKEFDEEVLEISRVTRVVKGGRRLRFRCLVAIGDRKGRVGIGIGKSTEVVNGIKKAVAQAKKSLIKVPITDTDSIPNELHFKYKAAKIFLKPASPGTGVIAGGSLRKILSLAGVKNVLSKNHGSSNKIATSQAAIMALQKLKPVKKSRRSETPKDAPSDDAQQDKPVADNKPAEKQKAPDNKQN